MMLILIATHLAALLGGIYLGATIVAVAACGARADAWQEEIAENQRILEAIVDERAKLKEEQGR